MKPEPKTDLASDALWPYKSRYIVIDGDVFEALTTSFGTCLINRTSGLRAQIAALHRRAQEEM